MAWPYDLKEGDTLTDRKGTEYRVLGMGTPVRPVRPTEWFPDRLHGLRIERVADARQVVVSFQMILDTCERPE